MRSLLCIIGLVFAGCRSWHVGEPAPVDESAIVQDQTWNVAVTELMSMQNRVAGIGSVQSYGDSLRITFTSDDAVTRAARVVAAAGETVMVRVYAAKPAQTAVLVTSGGFPAERIVTLETAADFSLLVVRGPTQSAPQSRPR